jgi:hypothetical protein
MDVPYTEAVVHGTLCAGPRRIHSVLRKWNTFLQTCNKINCVILRHFGKQMTKETKLGINNITAKAPLKFGSEAWVLKKRNKQRPEAPQIKFLTHLLGITKLDRERNQSVREELGVQNTLLDIKKNHRK